MQNPHEGEALPDLILRLVIGQVIESLQHEDFEHEHGIKWRTAALLPLRAAQPRLQRLAKALSRNVVSEAFQGIALLTEGRVTVGEIKQKSPVGGVSTWCIPP